LEKILHSFESNETIALTQAIAGLGGIGKTQIALKYAYRYKDNYEYICWINAETDNTILSSFQSFARKMNIPNAEAKEADVIIETVHNWMKDHCNWLFVYDNAEDEETLQRFLPALTGKRQHILITTRNMYFMNFVNVDIAVLTEEEACNLMNEYTRKPIDNDCKKLVNELGCLPLALAQAGAYIKIHKDSYRDYLDAFKRNGTELFSENNPTYAETVASTWNISFRKIKKNKAAKQLLHLCAFLAPEKIHKDFFTRAGNELPEDLSKAVADENVFKKAIAELTKYSIVSQDDEGALSIHRIVQEVIRDRLKRYQIHWRNRCILILNELVFGDFHTAALRDRFRTLATHILSVAPIDDFDNLAEKIENKEELATLYSFLGRGYQNLADYRLSLYYNKKALAIRENFLGSEHKDTVQANEDIGMIYWMQDDYVRALEYYEQAKAIREKVLGKEHLDTASTYNNMALVYDNMGDYEHALEYYGKDLAVSEKILDKEHPDTATAYNNMAVVYHTQGNYELALEYFGKALAIREKVLGKEHLYTEGTYLDAENTYKKSGKNGTFDAWLTKNNIKMRLGK